MKREKKNVLVLIVLNYNDAFTTMQFVNSIKEFECISKILIVDNSSTDNSIIKLQKIVNEKIELIVSSRNEGYATGNNIGIKYAKIKWNPDLICIANPDIIIEERTISRISNFIREHKEAGIVSCTMTDCKGEEQVSAWKQPDFWDCVLDEMLLAKKILKKDDRNYSSNGKEIKVDVIPGCFFICTLELMNEIDCFDESTFLYYEENILSYKIKLTGKQNYLLRDISYIHNHSTTINKNISSLKRKLEIAYRSRKIYCYKYLKIGNCKKIVLWFCYLIGTYSFILAKRFIR